MSWINFTNVVYAVFVAYVAYTVLSLSQLLTIPPCEKGDVCLTPYLSSDEPRLQLFVYSSLFISPSSENDLDLVYHNPFFDHQSDESSGNAEVLVNLTLPKSVRLKNMTMYLHMFLAAGDVKVKSWVDLSSSAVHAGSELVVHHTPPPAPYTLLGDDKNKSHTSSSSRTGAPLSRPAPHLRSVIPFSVMTDLRRLPRNKMSPEIAHLIRTMSGGRRYLPLLHVEVLGQRLEHLVAVADLPDDGAANITLRYTSTGLPRLKLWMQMEAALHSLSQLGFSPHDVDEVKGIFATSAPLLALTFAVSILHLLFDVLAFKNDISFWRGRESLVGLSGGAVLWRAFAQAIIFLHLLEEDTSLLVLAPAGVAVIIELWKVSKAYRMRYSSTGGPSAAAEDETRALDSQAFHYLSFVLYPLCGVGAVYSLLYVPHKSWYSWLVSSAVNGVYAFGFLFMLPQLFINYKLKSVAHLPWRAFMYKAFNTFIDDLFAFIITMPTSHRLACFRDDVVFLIYLYQRWLYPVDKSRINEFGGSGEEPQEGKGSKGKTPARGDKKKKE